MGYRINEQNTDMIFGFWHLHLSKSEILYLRLHLEDSYFMYDVNFTILK